jgi:DNA-directed RNA polymerase specialized sigma24 family protein
MQICKKQLADAVRQAKNQDQLTDELALFGLEIARLYLSGKAYSPEIIEDIISDWSLRFVRKWEQMNPDKNCFSWIVSTVRTSHYVYMRSLSRRITRENFEKESLKASAKERQNDWGRATLRFRYGDNEGIVPESEWLNKVSGAVA